MRDGRRSPIGLSETNKHKHAILTVPVISVFCRVYEHQQLSFTSLTAGRRDEEELEGGEASREEGFPDEADLSPDCDFSEEEEKESPRSFCGRRDRQEEISNVMHGSVTSLPAVKLTF